MRILLVRTSSKLHENYVYNRMSPPMGLMYLASSARQKFPDAEIRIVDILAHNDYAEQLIKFAPDIVGFSALTCEAFQLPRLISMAKSQHYKPLVIVGGPHATSSPLSIFAQTQADMAVLGEAETTFVEILEKVSKKESLESTAGTFFKKVRPNGDFEIIRGPERPAIQNLDALPFPAWDLIDIEAYQKSLDMNIWHKEDRYMTIFTSRGCPYQCIYCHRIFGKKPRFRSAESVVDEISLIVEKYNIREFQVIDDIYNLYPARVIKVAELLKQRGLKVSFSFPNGIRADIMNERILCALKDSGAYNLTVAVESASPRLQKLMKKGVDVEKAAKIIDMAADMGFIVNGFFMLGFPGETYYEMMGTIDFAVQSKLHHALFFSVNPHGFTELSETYYNKQATHECKGTEKFHYFNRYFHLAAVSPVMFAYIMLYANLKFYMQRRRVWALIKIAPSFGKFITQGVFFFFSIAYYNLKDLIRAAYHEYFPLKRRKIE